LEKGVIYPHKWVFDHENPKKSTGTLGYFFDSFKKSSGGILKNYEF